MIMPEYGASTMLLDVSTCPDMPDPTTSTMLACDPIRYTAEPSIVLWILTSYSPEIQWLCHGYHEVANAHGRALGLEQNVRAFQSMHFGKTKDEAVALLQRTNYVGPTDSSP